MDKFFTKYDIMFLLDITPSAFEWYRKKLNIMPIEQKNGPEYYSYTIQNMIDMYRYMIRKKVLVYQSKINYKTMWK